MTVARRDIKGGAISTTITGALLSTTLTIPIADSTGWPDGTNGKFYVAIDYEDANTKHEKILCTSRSGLNLTVASTGDRGVDGTSAQTHSSGARIAHVGTAADLDEANKHISDPTQDDHTQYLLASSAAGAGLSVSSRILAVNTDNSTVEINADTVRVKDGGITNAKLATMPTLTVKGNKTGGTAAAADLTVAEVLAMLSLDSTDLSNFTEAVQDVLGAFSGFGGSGLTFTYDDAGNAVTLVVNVDGTTLEINADALRIKDAGVSTAKLADLSVTSAKLAAATYTSMFEVTQAAASGSTTVSAVGNPAATPNTIPGTTITVTPPRTGCVYVLHGTADVTYTGGPGGSDLQAAVTALSIDNSNTLTSPQIIGFGKIAAVDFRVTLHQTWVVTQASLGDLLAHTFRLKAYKLAAGDTVVINPSHTQLTCTRFG